MELVINDRIRNRTLTLFNRVRLTLKYDSVASTFGFEYYFDPASYELKELSCIGHYHVCKITHLGETLLTGYVLSIAFNHGSTRALVSIGGYSLPGVLEDCEIPVGIEGMTLQNDGLSLTQIAQKYLKPFGIGLVVDGSVVTEASQDIAFQTPNDTLPVNVPEGNQGKTVEELLAPQYLALVPPSNTPQSEANANLSPEGTIDKYGILITPWGNDQSSVTEKMDLAILSSTAQVGVNIKTYLAKLASYKNIILSHDEKGNLVFTRAKTNRAAIANYQLGVSATSMSLQFDGQKMHSHITAVTQPDLTGGSVYSSTLRNPYVPYVFRPRTIVVNSPDRTDYTLQSAKNMLAEELRGLKLIITTDRWTFPNGKVIKPNNIISVINPEIYLYKKSKWFIESVELYGDEKQQTAKITCTVPNVYDVTQPRYLFQGINLH